MLEQHLEWLVHAPDYTVPDYDNYAFYPVEDPFHYDLTHTTDASQQTLSDSSRLRQDPTSESQDATAQWGYAPYMVRILHWMWSRGAPLTAEHLTGRTRPHRPPPYPPVSPWVQPQGRLPATRGCPWYNTRRIDNRHNTHLDGLTVRVNSFLCHGRHIHVCLRRITSTRGNIPQNTISPGGTSLLSFYS